MSEEVLFVITKENLDTGLRGFPVGTCVTSTVHPEKGLSYADIPVSELAYHRPEQVIYLLLHGKMPSEEEEARFTSDLKRRTELPDEVYRAIEALPREAEPMSLFACAILVAGAYQCKKDYYEDCLNLIAKIPLITAAVINHHAGWQGQRSSRPELGYMQNFSQMLAVPEASPKLAEVFGLVNILHYDHGGGNLSAFTGKAVASGLADQYASIASAMLALGGPLHGGASEESLKMLKDLLAKVGSDLESKRLREYIQRRLERREVIYGYGHAVLRLEDPRAAILYDFGEKHFSSHPIVRAALALRREAPPILKENPKIKDPYANVDAVTGAILAAAGFDYSHYFPVLFGLARTVGISIQIAYERLEARDGKGTPLVRPKYLYQSRKAAAAKSVGG